MTDKPKLEDKLLGIASLDQISRGINKSENPGEKAKLYKNLAGILSGGNVELFKDIYTDIRISPEEAMRYAVESTESRLNAINSEYETNEFKRVENNVIKQIKSKVESATNIDEAADILSLYLNRLHEFPELDQNGADRYAQSEIARMLGISMNFSAKGNISQYKQTHERLMARSIAREYLNESDGKYTLNTDALRKLMKEPAQLAMFYSTMKAMQEANKKK